MKQIHLGSISIPILEFASQGNAMLGIKGSGKTYASTGIAEQLLDNDIPFIAFDPIGVWRNLKIPGAGKGYKVVVAHPTNGDLPLTPESAPEIVRAAMQQNIPLVIDLYDMRLSKSDWKRIVESCIRLLLYENGGHGLRHIFIEEASEFVPQQVTGDNAKVYAEIEKLARMGGNASLGYTLINQRAEQVNKAVLELCDCLFLFRQKGKNSLTSLGKWLDFADAGLSKEIIKSLPTLPAGECWAWLQGSDAPQRIKMPEKKSFHPDRQRPVASNSEARANVSDFVQVLSGSLAKHIKAAKDKDPAHLKKRIVELEKQIAGVKPVIEMREIPTFTEADRKLIGQVINVCEDARQAGNQAVDEICKISSELSAVLRRAAGQSSKLPTLKQVQKLFVPMPNRTVAKNATVESSGDLSGGIKRMLIALAQRENGLTANQLGVRAGLSSRSGTFGTYLGKLRSEGWVSGDRNLLRITDDGCEFLGDYDPLPAGRDLFDYWMRELGGSGAGRMLEVLYSAYPKALTKQELGEASEMSSTSGTFGTYLGKLRSLELVTGKSEIKASEEFFE